MTGGWVSPSDHARAFYDSEGGAIPEVPMKQWRPTDAPAFGQEYADTIAEAARAITDWIDGEVERGATDALVAALRRKGWTVTPPPEPRHCPRNIPRCPLPEGHEHYSRTDEEIAALQETEARRRLGETVRDVERRERGER